MEAAGEQDEGTIQRQAEVGSSTPAMPWRKMRRVRPQFLNLDPVPGDTVLRDERVGRASRTGQNPDGGPEETPLTPLRGAQLSAGDTQEPQIIEQPTIHLDEQRQTQPPHEAGGERGEGHFP